MTRARSRARALSVDRCSSSCAAAPTRSSRACTRSAAGSRCLRSDCSCASSRRAAAAAAAAARSHPRRAYRPHARAARRSLRLPPLSRARETLQDALVHQPTGDSPFAILDAAGFPEAVTAALGAAERASTTIGLCRCRARPAPRAAPARPLPRPRAPPSEGARFDPADARPPFSRHARSARASSSSSAPSARARAQLRALHVPARRGRRVRRVAPQ